MLKKMSEQFSLKDCLLILYILTSIIAIIVLAVALGQCNKKCNNNSDGFCNCFGPQYDGSSGNPNMTVDPGTYCVHDRAGLAQSYREGKFLPQSMGVGDAAANKFNNY